MPLFWRVDIDIRADSVATDDLYDAGNPDARSDTGWSAPASAIENAVAAIKAAVRGRAASERAVSSPGSSRPSAQAATIWRRTRARHRGTARHSLRRGRRAPACAGHG
jgi:hypothetical protein